MLTKTEEALEEFTAAANKLKRAFAEEHCGSPDHFDIHVNKDNYITIVCTKDEGCDQVCYREWISPDQ